MTVSIGVAAWRQTDSKVEQIMARADAALYQVEDEGRNCVVTEPALAA